MSKLSRHCFQFSLVVIVLRSFDIFAKSNNGKIDKHSDANVLIITVHCQFISVVKCGNVKLKLHDFLEVPESI